MTNFNNVTVRVDVPDPVVLRTKELLSGLGVEAKFVDDLAEVTARDILATYIATADLPFDKSERWTPGERIKAHHRAEAVGGMVVRIERSLMVTDSLVVILDGEDTARGINADIISHETEPSVFVSSAQALNEAGPVVADPEPEPVAVGEGEDSENESPVDYFTNVFEILRESEPQPIPSLRLAELRSIAVLVANIIRTLPAGRRRAMRWIDLESSIHTGMGMPRTMNGRQTDLVLTYIKEI